MTELIAIPVRQYQTSDLNDLLTVWDISNRLAHPFLTDDFIVQERLNIENMYLPNADTWVVEINNKVVGFIALIGNEVGGLFVDPRFHSSGLGKALMDKASYLHDTLELDVFKANKLGRSFYCRYGFDETIESIHEATGNSVIRLVYTS